MAVSIHQLSRRADLGLNTASRLRAGTRSRPTAQTMLAIERQFGRPVAEQVGAVAEGRYTREINERVFQTEEGAA
jgi:transcriptional regulator with XRE-family HTH domain